MSRRIGAAIVLIVGIALLSACGPDPTATPEPTPTIVPQADYALLRGDWQRSGVYLHGGKPELSGELWTYKAKSYINDAPLVADGLAFVSVWDNGLDAIDVSTGQLAFNLGDYALSPTVVDGTLYYSGATLHAFDLKTRKEKWQFAVSGIARSPLVYDGVVYVGGRSTSTNYGERGALYAVDAATGKQKWSLQAGAAVDNIATDGGLLFFNVAEAYFGSDVVTYPRDIYAVDRMTGQLIWRFMPPDNNWKPGDVGPPLVYAGRVYAASDSNGYTGSGHLYAFDARTGAQLWSIAPPDESWLPQPLLAYDGAIYVASKFPLKPLAAAPIYALDAATGAVKWTAHIDGSISAPSLSAGALYIAADKQQGATGAIYALDPATGQQLGQLDLDYSAFGPPTIADNIAYVIGASAELRYSVLMAIK